jgi:hypothetical protein
MPATQSSLLATVKAWSSLLVAWLSAAQSSLLATVKAWSSLLVATRPAAEWPAPEPAR